ncbi:MAG: ABC transporter ATP-binding protein [Acutalibacteraceae bacterium]|nr:ABC transporter ATP-binding protein [Acutalibacteraceae bacterium]
MIDICGVSKSFGDVEALNDFTIKINSGSIFGLVGSNGSGKSTLLRILSGVYLADKGSVKFDDVNIIDNEETKGKTTFVSDFPYFSNGDTLETVSQMYKLLYPNWSDEKFKEISAMFPIDAKKRVINMSKGMQRQVALILALSTQPKYLFLDEIFDGLDPVVRQLVKKLIISEVAENEMTVIIASHNLRELEDFCDHIGFLHKGGVLLEKDIDDLKLDLHRIQIAFEKPLPENALKGLDIVSNKLSGKVYTLVVRGDLDKALNALSVYKPIYSETLPLTLEEIFISEMEVAGYDINNILG